MTEIILAVVIVGIIGLLFGALLAYAAVVFKVEKDDRVERIEEELPGANCGACGFAGCSAYATAIVEGGAPVNMCSVGKDPVAKKIATIMGVQAAKVEPKVARVMCAGDCSVATNKYEYVGISDCAAAARLAGGPKECPNGCLGFGSCIKACKFDAISIVDGIARIDETKCTACGSCIKTCPKNVIAFVPVQNKVWVPCNNVEMGKFTGKYCKAGCIGCKICEKTCPVGAITVVDNHATIDYTKCVSCGLCADKCPKKLIHKGKSEGIGV